MLSLIMNINANNLVSNLREVYTTYLWYFKVTNAFLTTIEIVGEMENKNQDSLRSIYGLFKPFYVFFTLRSFELFTKCRNFHKMSPTIHCCTQLWRWHQATISLKLFTNKTHAKTNSSSIRFKIAMSRCRLNCIFQRNKSIVLFKNTSAHNLSWSEVRAALVD